MSRLRLAVIGLGRACGEAILRSDDLQLAAFVHRLESLGRAMSVALRNIQTAAGRALPGPRLGAYKLCNVPLSRLCPQEPLR